MNNLDRMESLLRRDGAWDYCPAAFFTHFGPEYRDGSAAADRHLEFAAATGMDFAKIQFEHTFPPMPEIREPADWAAIPCYDLSFYQPALEVVEGVVSGVAKSALVIATIYSPYMCAGHATSDDLVTEHLNVDPAAVARGLMTIAESLSLFMRQCVEIGVDGFYISTQGGEAGRFESSETFERYVMPSDLEIGRLAKEIARFNVLHICDYMSKYADLAPYAAYPQDVISLPFWLEDGTQVDLKEAYALFQRPLMGGLDRKGSFWSDSEESFISHVKEVLKLSPERFILGADCTVSPQVPWKRLAVAIDTAHSYAGGDT